MQELPNTWDSLIKRKKGVEKGFASSQTVIYTLEIGNQGLFMAMEFMPITQASYFRDS